MQTLSVLVYDLVAPEEALSRGERVARTFEEALAAEHIDGHVYFDCEVGTLLPRGLQPPDHFNLVVLHHNNRFRFSSRAEHAARMGDHQCPIVRYTGGTSNPLAREGEIWFADPPVTEDRPISVEAAREILKWVLAGADATALPPILGGTTLEDAAVNLLDAFLPAVYGGSAGDHAAAWRKLEGFRDTTASFEAKWQKATTAYGKLTDGPVSLSELENLRNALLGDDKGDKKGLVGAMLEARRGTV